MAYRVSFRASADKGMDALPRNVQARVSIAPSGCQTIHARPVA